MKFARITSPEANAVLAGMTDDLVCTVQQEENMAAEITEIDALIESVDAELAASRVAESAGLSLDHRDAHPYRRNRRRTDRAVLRALPTRLPSTPAGEAA